MQEHTQHSLGNVETPYHRFVALVIFDQAVITCEKKVQQAKQRVTAADEAIRLLQKERETALASVRELKKKRDALELEGKMFDEELAHKRQTMDGTPNIKLFLALEQEIKLLEPKKSVHDDAVFALWEQVELAEKQFKSVETAVQQKIASAEIFKKEALEDLVVRENELFETVKHRDEKIVNIPGEWIDLYEAMRKQSPNPVVPLEENVCGGCGFAVPSGDRGAVHRHVLTPCQQCRRLLYDPSIFPSDLA